MLNFPENVVQGQIVCFYLSPNIAEHEGLTVLQVFHQKIRWTLNSETAEFVDRYQSILVCFLTDYSLQDQAIPAHYMIVMSGQSPR